MFDVLYITGVFLTEVHFLFNFDKQIFVRTKIKLKIKNLYFTKKVTRSIMLQINED